MARDGERLNKKNRNRVTLKPYIFESSNKEENHHRSTPPAEPQNLDSAREPTDGNVGEDVHVRNKFFSEGP
jgi:hypothetical protein